MPASYTPRRVVGESALRLGGKLLFFGKGESAADAKHLATEFTVRSMRDRRALAAIIAITTDTPALTASGNDFGFEPIFERQIEAPDRPGDVAIGMSVSRNSPNAIRAVEPAGRMSMVAAALTGRTGVGLQDVADLLLMVPRTKPRTFRKCRFSSGSFCAPGSKAAWKLS